MIIPSSRCTRLGGYQTKKGLSKQANEVLSLLKKALIRSDALSPALSIRIDSFHNCEKANMFLN